MIAEAVDAARACIPLAAYMALAVALPGLALGHQGQHWPLRGAWRTVRAVMPRRAPSACAWRPWKRARALASVETLTEPPEARPALPARATPAWARTDTEEAA